MSEDVRSLPSVDGWCLKELVVGHTSTLNFYQPVNTSHVTTHKVSSVWGWGRVAMPNCTLAVFVAAGR
jgi:hypothetical protein